MVSHGSGECRIACRTQGQQKFIFELIFSVFSLALSHSAIAAVILLQQLFSSNSPLFYTLVYFSIVHLPAVLIPSLEWTVFSKCLVDGLREYDSATETTAHLPSVSYPPLISLSLPSPPAAPSPPFLCWQKPILDGVSFCVMYLSHQRERVFSRTLQGPLTLRFIVSMEAEVDCLLSVMYFHWCPDTPECRDELYHQ